MAADGIGMRIAKRRHQLGLRQQDLAGLIGVSKTTVAKWESGRHYPLRHMGKLEQVLGIDLTSDAEPDLKMEQLLELVKDMAPGDREIMLQAYAAIQNGTGRHARNPGRAERTG